MKNVLLLKKKHTKLEGHCNAADNCDQDEDDGWIHIAVVVEDHSVDVGRWFDDVDCSLELVDGLLGSGHTL